MTMTNIEIDILLSFAGEDRDYVQKVALVLRRAGVKLFYDEFETTQFWGKDQVEFLTDIFKDKGRYMVMFISNHYAKKAWPTLERRAAMVRQISQDSEYILPARFDDTEIPGLLPTVGYVSLQNRSPEEFAELVVKKLREGGWSPSVLANRSAFLSRPEVDPVMGDVQTRMARAKREILISGNDCKFAAESLSGDVRSAIDRGVHVKIMCVDPKSKAVEMLSKIDDRFPTPDSFVKSMASVEDALSHIGKERSNFELRYLPILPAVGFFLTDPYSVHGSAKIEIYTAKPHAPTNSRPHINLNDAPAEWYSYFIMQWETYWSYTRSAW